MAFLPASQTVTHTYEATYLTIITNTGNVDTIYALEVSADPALNLELMIDEVYIPPHMAAGIPLRTRAAATGTYALTLQADSVSSAAAAEATGTLIVVVVNRPPAAVDDSVTTDEDTPVVVDVLANDVDPDGDTLSVAAVTSGTHGAVVNGGTVVTYMPDVDYCGDDSFAYVATDGVLTDTAAVSVTVTCLSDDAPEVDAGPDQTVDEGDVVAFSGTFTDTDGMDPHTLLWDFDEGDVTYCGGSKVFIRAARWWLRRKTRSRCWWRPSISPRFCGSASRSRYCGRGDR